MREEQGQQDKRQWLSKGLGVATVESIGLQDELCPRTAAANARGEV